MVRQPDYLIHAGVPVRNNVQYQRDINVTASASSRILSFFTLAAIHLNQAGPRKMRTVMALTRLPAVPAFITHNNCYRPESGTRSQSWGIFQIGPCNFHHGDLQRFVSPCPISLPAWFKLDKWQHALKPDKILPDPAATLTAASRYTFSAGLFPFGTARSAWLNTRARKIVAGGTYPFIKYPGSQACAGCESPGWFRSEHNIFLHENLLQRTIFFAGFSDLPASCAQV